MGGCCINICLVYVYKCVCVYLSVLVCLSKLKKPQVQPVGFQPTGPACWLPATCIQRDAVGKHRHLVNFGPQFLALRLQPLPPLRIQPAFLGQLVNLLLPDESLCQNDAGVVGLGEPASRPICFSSWRTASTWFTAAFQGGGGNFRNYAGVCKKNAG